MPTHTQSIIISSDLQKSSTYSIITLHKLCNSL